VSSLEIIGLKTYFQLDEGTLKAVDGVDVSVASNSTVGLIGESGSGKSVTARSIMQLLAPGRIESGQILLHGDDGTTVDVAALDPAGSEMRKIRGGEIAMVFQEPMTSLSPVHTIGNQISEMALLHATSDKAEAKERSIAMLKRVNISNPEQRYDEYPHQLSGGMRQRAMIAMALVAEPSVLIADEPTTALDVTVQAQILDLMSALQEEFGMAIVYITHDLGVVAEVCDTVNVMYLGRIVETATARELFTDPKHPYTRRLMESIPRLGSKALGIERLETIEGNVPVPIGMTPQCGFHSRCREAIEGRCNTAIPALEAMTTTHSVRCFLHSDATDSADISPEDAHA